MLNIYNAIKAHAQKKCVKGYMPSHKGNKKFNKLFPLSKLDTTELDVNGVVNAVVNAEKDIAQILGVSFARILCNGSTSGVFSIMQANSRLGDKIIINASAHKSVFNALELFKIEPIIVGEGLTDGLPNLVTADEIENALKRNKNVIGAFLTYPDYYGRCFDIESVAGVLRKKGKRLLIDGAHGGYFNFINGVKRASEFADFGVESAHKTLQSLNQGAYCYCKEEYAEELNKSVDKFISTSPCYPVLASVEYGIKEFDKLETERAITRVNGLKKHLEKRGLNYVLADDPLKVTIDFNGYDMAEVVKITDSFNVYFELTSERYSLFMASSANSIKDFKVIKKAIDKVVNRLVKNEKQSGSVNFKKSKTIGFLKAKSLESESIELSASLGRACAEEVGLFPPCSPILISGEIIQNDKLRFLLDAIKGNRQLFNASNGKIKVVKDNAQG